MLQKNMIKILLIAIAILLSACVNKRGISATYYNDCKEYYDFQGYYHKKCDENIVDYKEVKETGGKIIDAFVGKEKKPEGNVW